MGDEAFCVAQIVGDVDQLERILEAERRRLPARNFKRHDTAAAVHLRAREFVLRMVVAERIKHARDLCCSARKSATAGALAQCAAHAQIKRLEALQMHPGVERAHRRPGVAQEDLQMILEEILACTE